MMGEKEAIDMAMRDEGDPDKIERLLVADEFEKLSKRLAEMKVNNRILSIVKTKLEEAGLWYAKLLREERD